MPLLDDLQFGPTGWSIYRNWYYYYYTTIVVCANVFKMQCGFAHDELIVETQQARAISTEVSIPTSMGQDGINCLIMRCAGTLPPRTSYWFNLYSIPEEIQRVCPARIRSSSFRYSVLCVTFWAYWIRQLPVDRTLSSSCDQLPFPSGVELAFPSDCRIPES